VGSEFKLHPDLIDEVFETNEGIYMMTGKHVMFKLPRPTFDLEAIQLQLSKARDSAQQKAPPLPS
jgi:hypothetical protein